MTSASRRIIALVAAAAVIAVTAAVAVAQTSHDVEAWQACMASGGWIHATYAVCEDALFPPEPEPVEYQGWVPPPTTTAPPYHESNQCWTPATPGPGGGDQRAVHDVRRPQRAPPGRVAGALALV